MPDFLRDWGFFEVFVALLLAAIGGVSAIYKQRRNRKQIQYSVLYNSPLVNVEDHAKDKIEVLFNGQSIDDPRWASIKITNSGRPSISRADFEEKGELTVSLGEKSTILEATVTDPEKLKPRLTVTDHSIIVAPLLLNGGDSFSINVVGSGFDNSNIDVSGRVNGVRQIEEKEIGNNEIRFMETVGKPRIVIPFLILILGIIGLSAILGQGQKNDSTILDLENVYTYSIGFQNLSKEPFSNVPIEITGNDFQISETTDSKGNYRLYSSKIITQPVAVTLTASDGTILYQNSSHKLEGREAQTIIRIGSQ